jgi:tetratricopeptide (TPR) repeat protein
MIDKVGSEGAPHPGRWVRLHRWAQRHPLAAWAAAVTLALGATLGVSRLQQRAAITSGVEAALRDSYLLQSDGKLREALAALRRAEVVLNTGPPGSQAHRRFALRLRELRMATRLEEMSERHVPLTAPPVDFVKEALGYQHLFQEFGVEVDPANGSTVVDRINSTDIAPQVIVALDDWAMKVRATASPDDARWKALLALAQQLDNDRERMAVRNAVGSDDPRALQAIFPRFNVGPVRPHTCALLGTALLQAGYTTRAAALLRSTLGLYPSNYRINLLMADCAARAEPPQWDEAFRFYTAALALRPDSVTAKCGLGTALENKGRLEEALEMFRAAANDGHSATARSHYARLGQQMKQPDVVVAAAREAIRLGNDSAERRVALAEALLATGRAEEGLREYREAVRLDPESADVHARFLIALVHANRPSEAVLEYRKACQLAKVWHRPGLPDSAIALSEKSKGGDASSTQGEALLAIAELAHFRFHHSAAAAQAYVEAFAAMPSLMDEIRSTAFPPSSVGDPAWTSRRYTAAHMAVRASGGASGGRWRRQALTWLRADLNAWRDRLEKDAENVRPVVVKQMKHWRADGAFDQVRGAAIATLPAEERPAWQALWADVAAILARVEGAAAAKKD